jgi:glycerol-3-phosphate acyltransferase PlsY
MVNVLSIAAGYLLGALSSAWIITRLFGKVDIRSDADGRISPASVYRRLGVLPFVISALMDILLAFAAVALARAITGSVTVGMFSGIAAMIGHNWSPFLKFKGGQGATSMTGALAGVVFWPLCCGLVVAASLMAITRRSSMATAIGIGVVFIVALLRFGLGFIAFYPLILLSIMLIKRLQLAWTKRNIPSAAS